MDWLTEILVVAVVLGAIVVYLSSAAGRLDRLHHRIETAAAALDAQLLRRGAAAQDICEKGGSGMMFPMLESEWMWPNVRSSHLLE
mgnify:CR=1 FL=1